MWPPPMVALNQHPGPRLPEEGRYNVSVTAANATGNAANTTLASDASVMARLIWPV